MSLNNLVHSAVSVLSKLDFDVKRFLEVVQGRLLFQFKQTGCLFDDPLPFSFLTLHALHDFKLMFALLFIFHFHFYLDVFVDSLFESSCILLAAN